MRIRWDSEKDSENYQNVHNLMRSDKKPVGLYSRTSRVQQEKSNIYYFIILLLKSVLWGRKFSSFSHSNIGYPKNKNEGNSKLFLFL